MSVARFLLRCAVAAALIDLALTAIVVIV